MEMLATNKLLFSFKIFILRHPLKRLTTCQNSHKRILYLLKEGGALMKEKSWFEKYSGGIGWLFIALSSAIPLSLRRIL
jgi:hypothetical protein